MSELFELGVVVVGVALFGVDSAGGGEVATATGRLCARVAIDPLALRGVASCPKGHWPKLTADQANVNTLNPGESADVARSTSVHGIEVTFTRTVTPLTT